MKRSIPPRVKIYIYKRSYPPTFGSRMWAVKQSWVTNESLGWESELVLSDKWSGKQLMWVIEIGSIDFNFEFHNSLTAKSEGFVGCCSLYFPLAHWFLLTDLWLVVGSLLLEWVHSDGPLPQYKVILGPSFVFISVLLEWLAMPPVKLWKGCFPPSFLLVGSDPSTID